MTTKLKPFQARVRLRQEVARLEKLATCKDSDFNKAGRGAKNYYLNRHKFFVSNFQKYIDKIAESPTEEDEILIEKIKSLTEVLSTQNQTEIK